MLAAVIGGSAISGGLGLAGSLLAADKQKSSADKSARLQRDALKQSTKMLNPFRKIGTRALGDLGRLYGIGKVNKPAFTEKTLKSFYNSPDYLVTRNAGIDALDASAAARGNLLSGGHVRDIQEYGSNLGNRMFGNYLDRLANLAGLGENAAARTGTNAISATQGIGNTIQDAGTAAASGIVGGVNSINSALGTGLNNYFLMQSLANQNQSAYGGIGG